MDKCIIFLSKEESYLGSAIKIKEQSNFYTEIIYIEDYIMNKKKIENSIIYFLCNSDLVKEIVNIKEIKNCYIFNKKFFEKNYTKLGIQNILQSNYIEVPIIIDKNNINKINCPTFCKEDRHGGIVLKTYTSSTISRFFEKFNKDDFYLEESIVAQEELKLYFVRDSIYSKGNINDILKTICIKVSKLLQLEIFSIDIIKDFEDNYYVIDVNPSAGFYMLDYARKELINNIDSIMNKEEK